MNCRVSWTRVSNVVCTVLYSASTRIKFGQTFHIKFYIKCVWNFNSFLEMHIIFYKHVSYVSNWNNEQKNYLFTELLLSLLAAVFAEKTRSLSIFFSNSEFGLRVYRGKVKLEMIVSVYTFLRIPPRKINILKKPKLCPQELNEVNRHEFKKAAARFNEYSWNLLEKSKK